MKLVELEQVAAVLCERCDNRTICAERKAQLKNYRCTTLNRLYSCDIKKYVPEAEWKQEREEGTIIYYCSNCNRVDDGCDKFCSGCGAHMRGGWVDYL